MVEMRREREVHEHGDVVMVLNWGLKEMEMVCFCGEMVGWGRREERF